jgi:DNA replication protein DnaC
MAASQRNELMEIIEERHGLKATLIASQPPVEHWHDNVGEATLADAIPDRLLHNAHRLPTLRQGKKVLDGRLFNNKTI